MLLTIIASIALLQRQPPSFQVDGGAFWTLKIPEAKSAGAWISRKQQVDDKITYLLKDTAENRLAKLKGHIEKNVSEQDDFYAYTTARYLVEFQNELINNSLASKYGYKVQNAYGDSDIEFVATGYTALGLLKFSTKWPSGLGDFLLKNRVNTFPLMKAYVFEGIYCSKDEARIKRSFAVLDRIKNDLDPANAQSIRATLCENLYYTTKKPTYAHSAINAWKEYLNVATNKRGIDHAKGQIEYFKSRIG